MSTSPPLVLEGVAQAPRLWVWPSRMQPSIRRLSSNSRLPSWTAPGRSLLGKSYVSGAGKDLPWQSPAGAHHQKSFAPPKSF